VIFRLHAAWPDFLAYYSSVTGAGWIVPKRYVESVSEEGFKRAPLGAGPYRLVSFSPGVKLMLEAFADYWRRTPAAKKLVFKVIPDETTRLASLKHDGKVFTIRHEQIMLLLDYDFHHGRPPSTKNRGDPGSSAFLP
jgi:ABC-type transport system substrate-binding protein